MLAFSWQSVIAETHQHVPPAAASRAVAATHGGGKPAPSRAPTDSPANCPICRELAHATHYLPPAPIVFAAPVRVFAPPVSVAAILLVLRARSHGWQSRAPPLLQA